MSSVEDFFSKSTAEVLLLEKNLPEVLHILDYYFEREICYFPHEYIVNYSPKITRPPFEKIDFSAWPSHLEQIKKNDFYHWTKEQKKNFLRLLFDHKSKMDFLYWRSMILGITFSSSRDSLDSMIQSIKRRFFPQNEEEKELLEELTLFHQFEKLHREKVVHYVETSPQEFKKLESEHYEGKCEKIYRDKEGDLHELKWPWNYFWSYEFEYCHYKERGSRNNDILYYFPGLTAGPSSWNDLGGLKKLRDQWRHDGVDVPQVISVSMGRLKFFQEENVYNKFLLSALPYIESKLKKAPKRRFGLGISMGGGNLAHWLLKDPHMLNKTALICPSIWTTSPFSSREEIEGYINRNGANALVTKISLMFLRYKFGEESYFNSTNPLVLGKSIMGKSMPELYLAVGEEDELGLQDGTKEFYHLMENKGASVIFKEQSGPHFYPFMRQGSHCLIAPHELSRFFYPLNQIRFF